MPYDISPSPVAPQAGSRLWTAGASAGVAIVVLLGLAVYEPDRAWPLLAGALLVALGTWALNRRPAPRPRPDAGRADPPLDQPAPDPALLEGLLEALTDPVLAVS